MEENRTASLNGQENPDIIVDQEESLSYAKKWLFKDDEEKGHEELDPESDTEEKEETAPEQEQTEDENSHKPLDGEKDTGKNQGDDSPGLERVRDGQRVYLAQDGRVIDDPLVQQQQSEEPEELPVPVPEDDKKTDDKEEKKLQKKKNMAAYERQQQYIREADERQKQYVLEGPKQSGPVIHYEDGIPIVEDPDAFLPAAYQQRSFSNEYGTSAKPIVTEKNGMPGIDSGEADTFYEERVRERHETPYRLHGSEERPAAPIGEDSPEESGVFAAGRKRSRRPADRGSSARGKYYDSVIGSGNNNTFAGSNYYETGYGGHGLDSTASSDKGAGRGRAATITLDENSGVISGEKTGETSVSARGPEDMLSAAGSGGITGKTKPRMISRTNKENNMASDTAGNTGRSIADTAESDMAGDLQHRHSATIAGYKKKNSVASAKNNSPAAGHASSEYRRQDSSYTRFVARKKSTAGLSGNPDAILEMGYGTGAVSAILSTKPNEDERDQNSQIPNIGTSAASRFSSVGINDLINRLHGEGEAESGENAANVSNQVRASRNKNGTLLKERSRNGIIRLKATVNSEDPKGSGSRVRSGRPSRFAKRDESNISAGRSLPGDGSSVTQTAYTGNAQIGKMSTSALQGQTSPIQSAGSFIKGKLHTILKAAAKRLVAGTMAATVATGAVAGGSVMVGMRSDSESNSKWVPLQAHLSADGTNRGKSLTQETLEFLHARMRAYGIQTTYGDSSTATGAVTIHMPGYSDDFDGYDGGDGDSTIMFVGKDCFLIDGGWKSLSDMTQDYLKKRGVTEITAMVSHWHTDHYIALEKILEKGEIKIKTLYCPPPEEIRQWGSGDASVGNWMIKKIEESGGTVIMPPAGSNSIYDIAGLRMTVWRKTAAFHSGLSVYGQSYDYFDVQNDASLQVYFPDIYYYTGGDMYYFLDEFLDGIQGSKIKFFKCDHHGNGSAAEIPRLKDEFGAEACWYNEIGRWGELGGFYVHAANKADELGLKVFQTAGDIDVSISGGTARISGKNGTYSYSCPYTGGAGSMVTDDVAAYALSWVGENGEIKVPYKSSVTGNDPNEERSQPLAVGRGSDCSWFVYHVLMDCGVLADDTEFIHSYEWGSSPELYPNGHDVGTDLSLAKPGDVLCYAYGYPRAGSNSHVGIYIGNGEMVECAAGAGGVVKSQASDGNLISIVHFETKAGTASATVSPFIDLTTTETTSRYDFTPETEAIVEAHMHDFTYDNFDSFMAAHGGAENYVRSLGGVFAKWAGRDGYVQTAGEFQEVAEYVMGIYTIWGPDYMGGAGSHKFNARWGDGDQDGRFYGGDAWRWWRDIPLEEVFFHDKEHIVTDCGCGIYHIMQKAGLRDFYGGTTYSDTAQREVDTSLGGRLIFNKDELQVGDLIQMSHSHDESGWGHVCVVGEIHADGKIIAYDTGNRYVNTGSYKKELIFNDDGSLGGDYDGYYHWFGQRMREIAQTGGITSGSSVATQNLGDIRINSVTVDGAQRNRNNFSYNTLGRYTENGRRTSSVTKKFRFVDNDGNEISPKGLTSMGGGVSAGGSGADQNVGAGTVIEIPSGLGDIYTYMGWQTITSLSSNQYRLREQAGQNFDDEGFGRINGRYVIACTTTYGKVGDYVDFVKEDGLVLHCVIGDIKSRNDSGCNEWGHKNGRNVIEFVVDKSSWYPSGHVNPGTSSCHPEWSSCTVKAVNLGSYFTDPTAGGNSLFFSTSSSDTERAMYLAMQVLSMSVIGSRYNNPAKKELYQQYCFDTLDYAICESGGADVEYTSVDDDTMNCRVEVTIHCDLAMMEENDKNFTSWGHEHPLGDPEPASYMSLPVKTFNQVFNVDTFAGSTSVNPFTGNEEIVYEFFLGKGLGAAQIAGIMANIKAESNFNPKAINASSGAKGLFQWLGGRAEALDSYAQSRGKEWTDINCQLEYAWTEIDSDKGWNGNTAQKKGFMTTDSAKEAAIIFCVYWERAGSGTAAKRGEYAEDYYSTIMSANTMGVGATDYLQWAIATANDDSHGYSQASRNGSPDYDCSSFVFYALKNCGYDVGDRAFATGGMPSALQRLGFKMMPIPDESQLQPGDILWWDGDGTKGHTEFYLGQSKKVGARGASYGSTAPGDQSGLEVAITDYDGPGSFTHIFRR